MAVDQASGEAKASGLRTATARLRLPFAHPLHLALQTQVLAAIAAGTEQITEAGGHWHQDQAGNRWLEAAAPANEAERLAALEEYAVLDTPPDAELDDIVALAAETFATPMALISLVDEERQWFKACTGVECQETPRSVAICAHALGHEGVMVVPDTTKDERFAGNPLVTGEENNVRFYAGAPLTTPTGEVLGTLCVLDRVPRTLDDKQRRMLTALARQVMTRLELHRHVRELERTQSVLLGMMRGQQETEQALREAEERWHFALHGSQIGVWDWNIRTGSVFYSERWCTMLGHEPAEISSRQDEWSSRVHPEDLERAQALVQEHMEGRTPFYVCEHRVRAKDGTWRWIEARGKIIGCDVSGKPTRMVGTHTDVTELRLTQIRAEKARVLLSEAQQLTAMGTWDYDAVTGEVFWSPETCVLFGLRPEEADGTFEKFLAQVLPEDQPLIAAGLERARASEHGIIETEYRVRRASDGALRLLYERGKIVRGSDGREVRRLGVIMDITDRKASETMLRENQMLVRIAGQAAKLGGWSVKLPEFELSWSEEMAAIHDEAPGFSPGVGKASLYFAPEHRRAAREAFELCAKDGTAFNVEGQIRTAKGRQIWVRYIGEAVRDGITGAIVRVQGAMQDISALKAAEESLAESQRRFRMLADAMPFVVWTAAPEGTVDYCNRGFYDFTGAAPEAAVMEVWQNCLHAEDLPGSLEVWKECLEKEIPYSNEYRVRAVDGSYRWFRIQALPVWDKQGRLIKWYGAGIDIHEHKRLELEATQMAERLTNTLESITDAFLTLDQDWRFTYLNTEAEKLLDVDRVDVYGQNIWETYPSFLGTLFERHYRRAVAEQVSVGFEAYAPVLGRWLEVRAYPSDDGLGVYLRDVTEKKRQETHANMLSDLGQQLNVARSPAEAGKIITSVAEGLFGWDAAELDLYTPSTGLITPVLTVETVNGVKTELPPPLADEPPSDLERRVLEEGAELLLHNFADHEGEPVAPGAAEAAHEAPARPRMHRRGQPLAASQMFAPIRDGKRSIGLLCLESHRARAYTQADLHLLQLLADYCGGALERIHTESLRRESEERFRLLSRATNDAIWDWDVKTNSLWWNDGFETLFGFERDKVEPNVSAWLERVHPDDKPRVQAALREAVRGDAATWSAEYRYRCKDGTHVYVLDRGHIIRDEEGKAMRMIGGMTDLTEQRRADEQIRQQAALLDKAQEAILVRDMDHRVLYWNKSAERMYGWTAEEACGQDVSRLLYNDVGILERAVQKTLQHGEWRGEIEQVTKDGRKLIVEGHWSLVRDDEGNPKQILAINTDVTERKALEQQYLRAQRMESIGTLAGGIAHDLNNVLAPILMSIDLLKLQEKDPRRLGMLTTIEGSAKRGADMVRQVLSFGRGVEGQQVDVQVPALLGEVEKITKETFLKNIEVRQNAPRSGLWVVKGDPTQLHQVLLNLCVNARDAMPDGGVLTLGAQNAMLDEHYVSMNKECTAGPHVVITVEDSGTGMPPEIIDRIFEPFFTTKELGKGTGLGLSTSLGIIKGHGGFMRVTSEPDKGTKFSVYLPARADVVMEDSGGAPAAEEPDMPLGQGETVLLVDDEAPVREIIGQTLEAFGYRVVSACDGADATALYAARRDDIDVVLTDMMMPVLDGPATAKILKRMNPDLPIIGASGMGVNTMVARATEAGVTHFIPKPYTAETLLKALRDVLARTARRN